MARLPVLVPMGSRHIPAAWSFPGGSDPQISIQPFEPNNASRPMNGVASTAASSAVVPFANKRIVSVSPIGRAAAARRTVWPQTCVGIPKDRDGEIDEVNTGWPTAGPTGLGLR